MSRIVPRWEWRSFGDHFGPAENHLRSLAPSRVQESDELYLLALKGEGNVKVRDGLLDVKQLERVDEDGLEQWAPVMKAAFPLSAADVRAALAALGTHVPLARTTYTFDELVDGVVRPSPDLLAVGVHKHRERFAIGGCMAELTDVRTDRDATRTTACESEDPVRVIATVRELGSDSLPNVSYPLGLKRLVGFGSRRYAVIDVGTNSVKFHIGELGRDGVWRVLVFTPVYVVLLADLCSRTFRARDLLAAAVSVAGAWIVSRGSAAPDLIGIVLVQVSNLAFAAGQVWYRRLLTPGDARRDSEVFAALYLGSALLTAIPVSLSARMLDAVAALTATQVATIVYLGLVPSGLGFFLWNVGVRRSREGTAAACNNAKVPLAIAVAWLICEPLPTLHRFGEDLSDADKNAN